MFYADRLIAISKVKDPGVLVSSHDLYFLQLYDSM